LVVFFFFVAIIYIKLYSTLYFIHRNFKSIFRRDKTLKNYAEKVITHKYCRKF